MHKTELTYIWNNLFIATEEKAEYMSTEAPGQVSVDGEESLWKFSYDCFYFSVKQDVLSPAESVDREGGIRS